MAVPRITESGPLAGMRVLDLTQALAGPFCTMLLADLGADVIKVEPPSGDMTRYVGPFTEEDALHAYGGYFASINRGKRSIVLDLKQAADRDALLRLADTVDVVVENSRAGVMDRLGIGYETLAESNPRLVYLAIRGFGDPRTGASPYAAWPSYDIVAQAMGGLVSITGFDDGTLMKCGPSVGDIFTGALGAVGLLAAVLHARASGEGQFIDVAMYDAVLCLCEEPRTRTRTPARRVAPPVTGIRPMRRSTSFPPATDTAPSARRRIGFSPRCASAWDHQRSPVTPASILQEVASRTAVRSTSC